MNDIVFYNTLTRSKQPFEPISPGKVGMYTCGPTVYGPQHLGNLRSQLFPDLLKRFLRSEGLEVRHVINITDVGHLVGDSDDGDDKMELAAKLAGQTAEEIAEKYLQLWREDRAAVHCIEPEVNCKATDHITEQIALAQRLEERGYLYRLEDGIYFDISKFDRYAELVGLDLAGQDAVHRIDSVTGKRQPADFAVWKFADSGVNRLQEWDSPWGRGFPGWHLECSAMSIRYLGEHFDIHTAGIDLASVHHSNELAQSECAYDVHPWVNYWMHNEFLDFGGEKMSKSKGNVAVLSDLVAEGLDPMAFRYFFLQAHYRQQQTFNEDALKAAATGYRRLQGAAAELRKADGDGDANKLSDYADRFRRALADDLNAPQALAVVWELVRSDDGSPADRRELLLAFDSVLGLRLDFAEAAVEEFESDPRIDGLLSERQQARADKDFATADRIRAQLDAEGLVIIDTPEGSRWRRK